MPILSDVLTAEGALVDLLVGLSAATIHALRTAGRPVPSPLPVRALIDTGADMTCVDRNVLQGLPLAWGGMALANVPTHGGITIAAQHEVTLTIVHPSGNPSDDLIEPNLYVLELPLASLGFQALIGRDVLARCCFRYDGPASQFDLEY
jgi:hypothetical protein